MQRIEKHWVKRRFFRRTQQANFQYIHRLLRPSTNLRRNFTISAQLDAKQRFLKIMVQRKGCFKKQGLEMSSAGNRMACFVVLLYPSPGNTWLNPEVVHQGFRHRLPRWVLLQVEVWAAMIIVSVIMKRETCPVWLQRQSWTGAEKLALCTNQLKEFSSMSQEFIWAQQLLCQQSNVMAVLR